MVVRGYISLHIQDLYIYANNDGDEFRMKRLNTLDNDPIRCLILIVCIRVFGVCVCVLCECLHLEMA